MAGRERATLRQQNDPAMPPASLPRPIIRLARWTDLVYLEIIACGLYAGLAVSDALIDPADAAGTAARIAGASILYRTAYLADLTMIAADVLIALLFFALLRAVHPLVAAAATAFRLLQAAVLGANLHHLFAPVLLLGGVAEPDAETAERVAFHLRAFDHGYLTSGVFFAINCGLMGWLLYRSVHFPRFRGVVLGLAGLAYGADALAAFIAPSAKPYTEPVMLVAAVFAELGFCVWLLVRGLRREGGPS